LGAFPFPYPAHGQAVSDRTGRTHTVIPYRDGNVTLEADFQDLGRIIRRARGNVIIRYKDMVITADEVVYNVETRQGHTAGKTHFSQGKQWFTCSRAEFDFSTQTGTFYEASGYTDEEVLVTGQTILKTGPETYRIRGGSFTTCEEDNPKWLFTASRSDIRLDNTAHLRNTFLKIKGLPVFYTPYTIIPLAKKTRNSGFTTFETGTSTSKGRVFSQGYYQTLGRSADMTIFGDYFSLRGLAMGGKLRARPNPLTSFNFEAYGIRDKLGQGGVRLIVDGETRMGRGWRAVARVNITSSFDFRQAFADSFSNATVPKEHANVFLTQNLRGFSTNISLERKEIAFPVQSLITWKIPSLEIVARETPIGNSPFLLSFQSSIEGITRRDALVDTESLVQRMDIHPRMALRLPSLLGFSITPSFGIRETYYGAQLSEDADRGILNRGLHRRYTDLTIDLNTPVLEKDYAPSWTVPFRHVIEPYATYLRIEGIKNLDNIIRFDENDAIADTNEFEYGIVNRFYTQTRSGSGTSGKREFMTIVLAQKYYFDPSFGGAFRIGDLNSFYPLNTITGFYQTGIERIFSPLSATVRIYPKGRAHYDLRADYDTKLHRWRNTSISAEWQYSTLRMSGTYFRALETEPGMFSASQLQGNIAYGSSKRGFSPSLTISYNFQQSRLLNSRARLGYTWNCCSITTEFRQYALGFRTESQFSFSFWLKGLGSLGNMRGRDSLF